MGDYEKVLYLQYRQEHFEGYKLQRYLKFRFQIFKVYYTRDYQHI